MKTCEYDGAPFTEPRSHPWSDTSGSPDCRYYDLTAEPSLIRSSLEDFLPWSRYPAIETFYELIDALCLPTSLLESNDCAFEGPHSNENFALRESFECAGRVMVLFRDIKRNIVPGEMEQLAYRLHRSLAVLDPGFLLGIVGTTIVPVRYLALLDNEHPKLGEQLMISFWAWGDSEAKTMTNLDRLFKNLTKALNEVARA
jgi:hypothetical protein